MSQFEAHPLNYETAEEFVLAITEKHCKFIKTSSLINSLRSNINPDEYLLWMKEVHGIDQIVVTSLELTEIIATDCHYFEAVEMEMYPPRSLQMFTGNLMQLHKYFENESIKNGCIKRISLTIKEDEMSQDARVEGQD